MKKTVSILAKGTIAAAMSLVAMPIQAAEIEGWGDFKLYLDPGHSGRENRGLYEYSEAEKTLRVALHIKDMLETYTDIPAENLKLCRYTDDEVVDLEERSDEANAYGADFFYAIHSDASASKNTTVTLFGGWRKDGVDIEKTPNGGKAFGEILNPNLTGVMRITTRGNYHDRCYYDPAPQTHDNQYPYLSVNRRSNMPSLLSEGGYHTLAEQQSRNINDDYKRLEAFAAFQAILQYRNMSLPVQTFLTGVVSNSENGQPINGATITVDGKTYTTDTWESVFHKYTNNKNLIHNGFYLFENLTGGQEYEVEFSAPGFETKTETITINTGGATTADYVTYLDVALTNVAPAKVDAISISDPTNVTPIYPIVITFSRNMDKESVEQAFSIDNQGDVTLTWTNDYTLNIDISKLLPLWDYTIKIDGSVAKNSQTGQQFDGDGDGVEGGDYVLNITMAEPDVTPAQVVSTYPEDGGEALYSMRPPIRIEFDEILDWNDDKNADFVTLKSSSGKEYSGTLTHAVINERSVLHFYTDEDLAADEAYLVSVAPGLTDLSGNESDAFYFRFLSEYRAKTQIKEFYSLENEDGFWAPSGSGSSSNLSTEGNEATNSAIAPNKDVKTSFTIKYSFDESATDGGWLIRDHHPNGTSTNDMSGVFTMWVYGDGSNNTTGIYLRANYVGLKYRMPQMVVDFRGWKQFSWDITNDEFAHFTGTETNFTNLQFDAIYILHEYTDPDDEETPFQQWTGQISYNSLEYNKWDDQAERQAKIDDIEIPSDGIETADASASDIKVTCANGMVVASAHEAIRTVDIYNVSGAKVASVAGKGEIATLSVSDLASGIYVVNVATSDATKTVKIVK